jgi:hypothetical protein
MTELEVQVKPIDEDLEKFLRRNIDPAVCKLLESPGVYLCGGIIRAHFDFTDILDIDVYFRNHRIRKSFIEALRSTGGFKEYETDNALTFTSEDETIIQACTLTGTPYELIKSFDFTAIQMAVSLDKGHLFYSPSAAIDAINEVLVYTGSTNPLGSLKRAIKYSKKGYKVTNETLARILHDISKNNDLSDVNGLIHDLGSSGEAYPSDENTYEENPYDDL